MYVCCVFRLVHIFKPEAGDLAAEQQGERLLRKTCPMILSAPCMILHCDGKWGYSQSATVCSASSNMKHKKRVKSHTGAQGNKIKPQKLRYYCSVAKACPILCNPIDCSTPGSSVLQYVLEFAQIHVHWVNDAI